MKFMISVVHLNFKSHQQGERERERERERETDRQTDRQTQSTCLGEVTLRRTLEWRQDDSIFKKDVCESC